LSKDEPPLGSVGLSAFAVALIFVVWPLIMGGSISLAIFFGEEIEGESAPEDTNGFRFLDLPPSSCSSIMNNPSTSVLYNPNSVNFGNGTTVTFYGMNGNQCQSQATMILQIPTPLMNQEDSISEMRYEFLGTGYSTNPPSSFDTARMDIELKVNGESIWSMDNYEFRNLRYNIAQNRVYNSIDFIHEWDGIELLELRSEIGECEPNCNVTLTFSDYQQIISNPYQPAGFFQTGWHRIDTKTTDADTEGLIMAVSPWVVTGATLLVAIGSTRIFNPLAGFIGGRF